MVVILQLCMVVKVSVWSSSLCLSSGKPAPAFKVYLKIEKIHAVTSNIRYHANRMPSLFCPNFHFKTKFRREAVGALRIRARATRDRNTTTYEYHYNSMNNIKIDLV